MPTRAPATVSEGQTWRRKPSDGFCPESHLRTSQISQNTFPRCETRRTSITHFFSSSRVGYSNKGGENSGTLKAGCRDGHNPCPWVRAAERPIVGGRGATVPPFFSFPLPRVSVKGDGISSTTTRTRWSVGLRHEVMPGRSGTESYPSVATVRSKS
ncbi:MAG: hypothetical protein WAX69_19865 [Victivallales bacterium]